MMVLCKNKFSPKAVQSVFIFTYDRLRRYGGAWNLERKLLFPAHVFLESENEDILLQELKKSSVTAKTSPPIRISKEEEQFLRILCGKEHHLQISKGIICKGAAHITEGPLKGMESRICKIDRHKRLAQIATTTLQDYRSIPAGLEITEKIL